MVADSGLREGVFISYAREDGEVMARELHQRLATEAPDIVAWLDRYEIEGGVGWWNQVEQALDRAEYLILIMTPAALRSDNTSREWRSARQRGVCVYPVKGVPDVELDYLCLPQWMRKAHFYDPYNEWQKLIAHLRRGCQATRVPFMPPSLPDGLVKRQRETDALLGLLLTRSKEPIVPTTVLRGPGGFGKTTLAASVCYDERTIDTFDDGILWVTLGQSPNLLNELMKVYAALTGERPGFVDIEDAARELALKLESKSCLIVIDDVWDLTHIQPFMRGGVRCARLITTRLLDLSIDAQRIRVDQMTSAEGLQLLLARTGVKPDETEPFRDLVSRLGQWPLAIKLAGSAMRQRIERGATVDNALDFVIRTLDKRGITAFDREQASQREDAVMRTVGASLDLLKPVEQQRYAELAIFREDEAISVTTAATLWQLDDIDSEDFARKLDDLALLEFDVGRGTLRLHDVLFGFIADRLPDASAVHGKLVHAWGDPYHLPDAQAWRSYASHLCHANQETVLRSLLLDLNWITAKLQATDIHSLLEDFEHVNNKDHLLCLVGDALRLSAPALATDTQQLRTQLIARTLGHIEPEIVALRETALRTGDEPWLRLLHPTLDMPGGMLMMTLTGHSREVTSLAIDADYRQLVSASKDGTVHVWDTSDGRLLNILNMFYYNGLGFSSVASSGDGQIVLGGGADGLIYKWDVARGEEPLCHFSRDAGGGIRELAASSDMRIAVSTARVEPHLRVWDVSTRALLYILMGHSDEVLSVAMSADGARAVSGSSDCSICVWNLRIGKLERTLKGHNGPVNAVALTTDGRYALSGSSDCTVKFWDVETGICLHNLLGHKASVLALGLAKNGKRGISGASDSDVILWDTQKGNLLAHLNGHSDAINAVIINDTGTRAATSSTDCTIKLWRIDNPLPLAQNNAHTSTVSSLVFSPDGRLCASGSDEGSIKIHEVESGVVVREIDVHVAPLRSLAFTRDCECVLSGDIDGTYRLCVIETGDNLLLPIHHLASIDFSAMSATARYLITTCADRFVYLWDLPSGVLIARYGTRRLFDHLITPSWQRQKLADLDEYLDAYLPGETVYDVVKLYMSGDGVHVILSATPRASETIRLGPGTQINKSRLSAQDSAACLLVLRTDTWEVRSMIARQSEPISAFAVDASGKRLLWARLDHTLEVWDLEHQIRIVEMDGHREKVNMVAFSCNGARAFSCSRDRTLRVWNIQTGQTMAMFTADAALRSLAIASDDSTIAAGDNAGRVHILQLRNLHPKI